MQLVVFSVDDRRYALPLHAVERVVHAVEVTPLPGAPAVVLGAINVAGRVLPVLNLRRRFDLPEREIGLSDQFVITTANGRSVVLVVDQAQGVIERSVSGITDAAQLAPGLEQFDGVVELEGGLVLIQNPHRFLDADEARLLAAAAGAEEA